MFAFPLSFFKLGFIVSPIEIRGVIKLRSMEEGGVFILFSFASNERIVSTEQLTRV